jgi:NADH-quinone oxidoreductase subunit N
MNSTPDILRILPEVILTLTGVAVMMIEAMLKRDTNRAPLGWFAIGGIAAALWASVLQFRMTPGMAFHDVIQTDAFSGFFHILICGIALVTCLIALDSFPRQSENVGEFFALVLFGTVGMVLMSSAVELLLVFIALEISSISTYILAGFRKHTAKGPEASLKYFLLGSFATAFFLYGVALVFGATGTTNIHEIAARLSQTTTPSFAVIASALMLIGIGFKVSAAPFQVWTPDVYEGAPSAVVALMSTGPKAAAFAVLVRIAYGIFPLLHAQWSLLLWLMAALSMTVGNLCALRQQNVKRMLAYSSIAHAGYLLVAFSALSNEAIAAASFYAVAYAAMNVGVFAIVSHVGGYDERVNSIGDYRGLAYTSPVLGAVLAFFLISLIGIPFTGGFFGKFYVFTAAVHGGAIWLAIIGLLNSGIAAYYYLRLLTTAYTRRSEESAKLLVAPVSVALAIALALTVGATLVLGIMPGRVLRSARAAAQTYAVDSAVTARAGAVATPLQAHR